MRYSQCTSHPSTRYPFYRWVGWCICDVFSSWSAIQHWVIIPKTLPLEPPGHPHPPASTCTHARTHAQQKPKCLAATRVMRTWQSQDTCAPSRYCVPVLRSLLEAGKELTGALTVSLTAGVGTEVPPMPLVIDETQPVYYGPQYKTRYPFYRWVGWSTCDVVVMFFSSCSGVRGNVLWVISPILYQLNQQGTHPPTHPPTHTHT